MRGADSGISQLARRAKVRRYVNRIVSMSLLRNSQGGLRHLE